jgi:hypothetical protein
METYQELKKRQHDEFGAFEGIFFAFSNEQMKEGIEKHGVNENNKIVNIGAGGFVLKSRLQEFKDLIARHEAERKELKKNEKELIEAIAYELANHEYCITWDVTDALDALGLTRETVSPDILKKAIKKHNEGMVNV